MNKLKTTLRAVLETIAVTSGRALALLLYPAALFAAENLAPTPATTVKAPFLSQLTAAIDARTALLVSIISILILAALWKTDFKSAFGIWGGRLIIFFLVVLNIFLWSTQI